MAGCTLSSGPSSCLQPHPRPPADCATLDIFLKLPAASPEPLTYPSGFDAHRRRHVAPRLTIVQTQTLLFV